MKFTDGNWMIPQSVRKSSTPRKHTISPPRQMPSPCSRHQRHSGPGQNPRGPSSPSVFPHRCRTSSVSTSPTTAAEYRVFPTFELLAESADM